MSLHGILFRMEPFSLSLSQRLLRTVLFVGGGMSLLFGLLFLGLFRAQLEEERAAASLRLNQVLQAAWENAMLKRDIPGLRDIVTRLGELPEIRSVLILSPAGEVRFSSDPSRLGETLPAVVKEATAKGASSRFQILSDGSEVVRSINPVPNRPPCAPCHGSAQEQPINGILVIDYDAAPLRAHATRSALAFLAAGSVVLLLLLTTLWLLLRRDLLRPVQKLTEVTEAFGRGDLTVRLPAMRPDEIGQVARRFNEMADRLSAQWHKIRAQESYLQQILDTLPDGLRVIRRDNFEVVFVNRAFCQQLGISASEALGKPCYWVSHQRQSPCLPSLLVCPQAALTEVGTQLKAHHHHVRSDGSSFPVEVNAALVAIDGPEHHLHYYLVEVVRDLGEAIQISQQQRLSEIGMLAAGIAHEIHNPLASIRLGVQGLLRELHTNAASDELTHYLRLIDHEIDKCTAVTRRLLLLARAPEQALQLVELVTIVQDTLALLAYEAQVHQIDQKLEAVTAPVRILGDDAEMRMLFLNLIQNAHHAMPKGGTLTVRIETRDGYALVAIRDTGVGIAPEFLPRIFDPFFSRRADGVKGTGLGLTIVKRIVERHNGSLEVSSTVGEGSCFLLRLPLAEREITHLP